MMETTARLGLPLLAVAQAAKEMTINEALTLLDTATQPVVEGVVSTPPGSPMAGQAWLIDAGATDAFAGHDDAIAVWTAGGWRFVSSPEGMMLWRRDIGIVMRRTATGWVGAAAIGLPTGGSVIDIEARAAITTIVTRMRDFGLITS